MATMTNEELAAQLDSFGVRLKSLEDKAAQMLEILNFLRILMKIFKGALAIVVPLLVIANYGHHLLAWVGSAIHTKSVSK